MMADSLKEGTDMDAQQATKLEAVEQASLNIKLSAKDRLERLSGLRINLDAINFPSSKPHAYGGKAEVIKATLKREDGNDDQPVAVKKLRYSNDINKRGFCNEFANEVEIMAGLSHHNIIRLIGFVEDWQSGKAWFVLSWEPNGNVREFLATGEWEIPERISLIKDTFAGIEYLHTLQPPICHGDLKSLNILVSASYQAVITDFGSARILKETETRQEHRDRAPDMTGGSVVASAATERIDRTQITINANSNHLSLTGPAWSLRWVAPEVAMGQPQNLASDIWAAGWICWEIMTNQVPFHELDSESAITLKVIEGQVPATREDTQLSQVVRLCSLMTDCWIFNPQNRANIARCISEIEWVPSVPPLGGKDSGSKTQSAELLMEMGRIRKSQGSYSEAILLFEQALSAAKSAGDERTRAKALAQLGKTYYLTAEYTRAERYLAQAQDIFTQIDDDFGQANVILALASLHRQKSNLTQAEEFYNRAQNIYSRICNDEGQAFTLRGLGNVCYNRSRFLEAKEFYDQAQRIHARIGDDNGQATTLRRIGNVFFNLSEYTKAEESYSQALDIYSRIGGSLADRVNVLYGLGHLYRVQGFNTKAASFYADARSIFFEIGNSKEEKRCSRWLNKVLEQGHSPAAPPPSPDLK